MILSNQDLQSYIKYGGLKFSPPLQEDQFQQNGIDLILDSTAYPYVVKGNFILGTTKEIIEMPNDLMAFVQLRSTWAREGFLLPPTVIDAGFKGTITLEIISFKTQFLPVGKRFAHIIFAKLTTPTAPYAGKYQNQFGITEAIDD